MEATRHGTYDDSVTIPTPEGVDLNVTLAGIGSRFSSALVDTTIQIVIVIALTIVVRAVGLGGYGDAALALGTFLVVFGYDVLFEVLASGRTPGKRMNGLRVVRSRGQPVDVMASVIRNTLRIIDFLPVAYLIGIVSILSTSKNQRLGDLAAGTLVVRERKGGWARGAARAPVVAVPAAAATEHALDVSAITPEELVAVRSYLARRPTLTVDVRQSLAHTLAERLRPKVGGVTDDLRGERFLEALVAAKGDGI